MSDDTERLVVLLEARIRDFEKNMQKASGTAGRTYGGMRRDSRSATRQMEADMQRSTSRINQLLAGTSTKIGAFGKAFVGGLFAGGVAGLVTQIGQVARGIAEIGDKAKMAGLSIEAFQELAYVAKANRIEVDALTDGMKELALRADEYIVTGKGSAAESFERLGLSAEQLKRKLEDPSALFSEIIGKLQQLDRAAQIRIADELFGGTGGEKFVQLIEQGEQGIADTIAEARRLGLVMDDELIKKAAELDRQFNRVADTVGTALKKAIVEAAGALEQFIGEFRKFDQRYQQRLNANDAGAMLGGLVQPEGSVLTTPTKDRASPLDVRMAGTLVTELSEADQKLVDALRERYEKAADIATKPDKGGGVDRSARQQEILESQLEMLRFSLLTEEEAERASHANRLLEIEDFYDRRMISQQEYNEMTEAAQEEHAARMAEMNMQQTQAEEAYLQMKYQAASDIVGLLTMVGDKSKTAAIAAIALNKAVQIANVIQNTASAAMAAVAPPPLGLGPVAGMGLAAGIKAMGAAQIGIIAASGALQASGAGGSGGRTGGGGGIGSAAGGGGAPSAQPSGTTQAISIHLSGDTFARPTIEELIEELQKAQRNGHKLFIQPA